MKLAGVAARRFLDKPDPAVHAVLLYGPNRGLSGEAAKALTGKALHGADDPFALTRLSDEDLRKDKARLADALAAQSLLGGNRIAWVRLDAAGGEDAILAALAEIEAGAPGAFLIVEAGDLGGGAKLVKAFEAAKAAAALAFYEETEAERLAFARELLAAEHVTLTRDAGELLAARLPEERGLARQEILKLAAYAHGQADPLDTDDLAALLPDDAEGALDEAAAAALEGRAGAGIEALARIDGLSGVSALKTMERKLLRLLEARALMDGGLSPTDAAAKLRPPVFWKERDAFQALLRAWNEARLLRALDALWKAEIAAKQAASPHALLAADAYRAVARLRA